MKHIKPRLGRRLTATAVLVLLVIMSVGCGKQEAPAPPGALPVTVETPVVRDVTEYYEYTGNLAPVEEVEIVARVSGYLIKQNYKELDKNGQATQVKAGDTLFEIEHEPYEIARRAAEAEVERAKALELAAKTKRDKVKQALEGKAATQIEMIEAEAEYKQRVAERMAAEASLEHAVLDEQYTYVKSPINGVVSRNYIDVGSLVGMTGPTVLTKVTRMKPIWAYFDVSERIVLEYLDSRSAFDDGGKREAVPVELARASDPPGTYPFKGKINFVDTQVDPGTATITVRAELPNDDVSLFPGLFVRMRVPYDTTRDAVLVKEDAIGTDLGGKFVFVVDEKNVANRRGVVLGSRADGGYRVVKEGLSADEQYISVGIQRARPGSPVKPMPTQADAGKAGATANTGGGR